jgi:hypothetical protein
MFLALPVRELLIHVSQVTYALKIYHLETNLQVNKSTTARAHLQISMRRIGHLYHGTLRAKLQTARTHTGRPKLAITIKSGGWAISARESPGTRVIIGCYGSGIL